MITIDLNDDPLTTTEKTSPTNRPGMLNRIFSWLTGGHGDLLEDAHTAYILKAAKSGELSIDVQRSLEKNKHQTDTLAERYTRRSR
jgi:hypothetical protein